MVELFEIMDEMCEMIYVADMETHELYFINSRGKQMFQLGGDVIGQKCYRVLQGRDSPCPFCTNELLRNDQVYSWEIYNPLLKRHYALKDKRITWNGRESRIEIALDTTESENEKLRLQNAVESERVIMDCIRILYQGVAIKNAIPLILEKVGPFLKADRAYFIDALDQSNQNGYEWCAEGITSQQDYQQYFSKDVLEKWLSLINKHECYVVHDVEKLHESNLEAYNSMKLLQVSSMVVAPLEHEGQVVAYIGVDNPPKESIDNSSMIFYTLRYFLMAAIRREADEKQLTLLSYHDSLTGAYNRNRYTKDLLDLCANNTSVGIVYMDINGLKAINDQKGHSVGDQVIKLFANTVAEVFGLPQVYRLGGDEFVVLCKDTTREEFFRRLHVLKQKFEEMKEYSAAVGHQWAESSVELEHDVTCADAMMYDKKKEHYHGIEKNNRYRYINDEILALADPYALEASLNDNRFLVYLQPKVILGTRELVGAEALVRYRNREGSIVTPDQFLPLLEKRKLICMVDYFMFDKVCSIIATWVKNNKNIVPVSVNFSRSTIADVNFVKRLNATCMKHGVDRSYLEIEITESTECDGNFNPNNFTKDMHESGYLVSIDDFGVDHANFSILTLLDVCKLKIDKSLVASVSSNFKTRHLIQALLDMCQSMNIAITVEGVETEQQAHVLTEMGFQEAQGYLFGKPIPVDVFEEQVLQE